MSRRSSRPKVKKTFYFYEGQVEAIVRLVPNSNVSEVIRATLDRLIEQLEQKQEMMLKDLKPPMEDDLNV